MVFKYSLSTAFLFVFTFGLICQSKYDHTNLILSKRVKGNISPKSIVFGGDKLFAQNMMYKHTITIYDTTGKLLSTLKDTISPSNFGDTTFLLNYQGAPVEAAITSDKTHMWVSNYQMYGTDFKHPGCDACNKTNTYDHSYLYAINTKTLVVDKIAKTGSVPKFVACSPDGLLMAVSNWSDGTVTILNQYNGKKIKSINVGKHPRGLVFNKESSRLFVAVMGADLLIDINLSSGKMKTINTVGDGPRHLLYADSSIYVTLNNQGIVKKWDLKNNKWTSVKVGRQPRSMTFSNDSSYIYVVNYKSNSMSKIRTEDMEVTQTISTDAKPIGITTDPVHNNVWVACYSGSILKYQEQKNLKQKEEIVTTPEAEDDIKKSIVSIKNNNHNKTYHIIVGSFPNKKRAQEHSEKLNKKEIPTLVLRKTNGRYRVSAFQSNNRRDANLKLKEFKKTVRKDAWLLKKNN